MPGAQPLPEPILTGTKDDMKAVPPYDPNTEEGRQHGQLFVTDRDIFRYDATLLSEGPTAFEFDGDETPQNTNAVDSLTPDVPEVSGPPAQAGRWKSLVQTRGYIAAERVFGVQSGDVDPFENAKALRACVQEAMKIGRHRILLPEGEIFLDPREGDQQNGDPVSFEFLTEIDFWNTAGTTPYTEQDLIGGRVILMGHGPGLTRPSPRGNRTIGEGTTLVHVGTATNNIHAFLLGGSRTYQSFGRVIHLKLQDLALEAQTDANKAVLRMDQAWGGHFLDWVHVRQYGDGNGIDANNLWLGRFNDIVVSRRQPQTGEIDVTKMDVSTLADSDFKGAGFWIRTTLDDLDANEVYVGGEFVLNRLSAFGPWKNGMRFGDPHLDPEYGVDGARIVGGISAQFLNAEKCFEGIVIGAQAHALDLSAVWVERNRRCGVRVYGGAKNVALRRVYALHEEPEANASFEGEVVLGYPVSNTPLVEGEEELRPGIGCENVLIDGLTQHKIYGSAVTITDFCRDITIRDVETITLTDSRSYVAEALINVRSIPENLVIENVQQPPAVQEPNNPSQYLLLPVVSHPERAARIVYSKRDRDAGGISGSGTLGYEQLRNVPVKQEALHDLLGQGATTIVLAPDGPFYHRVRTGSGDVTPVLPLEYKKRGLEFHIAKVGGNSAVLVKPQDDPDGPNYKIYGLGSPNGLEEWRLADAFSFVQTRWTNAAGGTRQWEVVSASGPSAAGGGLGGN